MAMFGYHRGVAGTLQAAVGRSVGLLGRGLGLDGHPEQSPLAERIGSVGH